MNAKKPRNRAAQDATLINIRKLKIGATDLKRRLDMTVDLAKRLNLRVTKLEHYVGVLMRDRRKTFYISGDN